MDPSASALSTSLELAWLGLGLGVGVGVGVGLGLAAVTGLGLGLAARLVPLDEARGRGGERLGVIDGGAEGRRAERQWRRHTYGPAQRGKREEVDLVRVRVVRVKGEGTG